MESIRYAYMEYSDPLKQAVQISALDKDATCQGQNRHPPIRSSPCPEKAYYQVVYMNKPSQASAKVYCSWCAAKAVINAEGKLTISAACPKDLCSELVKDCNDLGYQVEIEKNR